MTYASVNRRIAKNTAMLYIRMLLMMVISLYTSRIVLRVLGVEDFGIYNLVAGFTTMFAFLKSSMSSATVRFLTFFIGNRNYKELTAYFKMSVNIHFIIAFIIVLLAETVGLWFLNNKMTIPNERLIAANWIYQFSLLALIINVISVPYNALIIAHERMSVFAWISIIEAILKVLIILSLNLFEYDKLKLYGILIFFVAFIIRLAYTFYCNSRFSESKFQLFWDKKIFKILLSFTGWNLFGSVSAILQDQGINVLLNIFFGPIINAARGIAFQVKSVVLNFVNNFQTAMNPQIIKSFASNDFNYMHKLIFQGAKYSFYLLFLLSLPILIETRLILKLWLNTVPEHTVVFTKLVLINILIDVVSGTIMTSVRASGNIKMNQLIVGSLMLLNLPLSYLFLKLGFNPEVTLYISILLSIVAFFARLIIVAPLVNLSKMLFFKKVIIKILLVSSIATIFPVMVSFIPTTFILRLFVVLIISFISVVLSVYSLGLDKNERLFLKKNIKDYINRVGKNK